MIPIPIQPDEHGFTGRECPNPDCEGYFKIEIGTGLKGENLPCHCPYCGHTASHNQFWTKEQLEYVKSVAFRKTTDVLHNNLKKLEFDLKPQGTFGIGTSLKVTPGRPTPIHYYREKRLETEVICRNCTLRYSVYGIFAFCPDCGQHNSLQILDTSLEVVDKMLDLSATVETGLSDKLIENALEDCISTFDGFGRELCRVHAAKFSDPAKAAKVSFQNLEFAAQLLLSFCSIDLVGQMDPAEWSELMLGFQKRHLITHKMGVIDDEYVRKTGDCQAVVGCKITIRADEARELTKIARRLAQIIAEGFQKMP